MKKFYQTNIDISSAKECFNFLKNHFQYDTMNSWNGLKSIANNVKIYNLGLEGDYWSALNQLQDDDYFDVNMMIEVWEAEHPGYKVGFNGRSGGYLVLYNESNNRSVLPDYFDYDTYEDWKESLHECYCPEYVCEYKYELRELVKVVRDFDRLCDELTGYVNQLSLVDYADQAVSQVVDEFNDDFNDELEEEVRFEASKEMIEIDVSRLSCSLLECLLRRFETIEQHGYAVKLMKAISDTEVYPCIRIIK